MAFYIPMPQGFPLTRLLISIVDGLIFGCFGGRAGTRRKNFKALIPNCTCVSAICFLHSIIAASLTETVTQHLHPPEHNTCVPQSGRTRGGCTSERNTLCPLERPIAVSSKWPIPVSPRAQYPCPLGRPYLWRPIAVSPGVADNCILQSGQFLMRWLDFSVSAWILRGADFAGRRGAGGEASRGLAVERWSGGGRWR